MIWDVDNAKAIGTGCRAPWKARQTCSRFSGLASLVCPNNIL